VAGTVNLAAQFALQIVVVDDILRYCETRCKIVRGPRLAVTWMDKEMIDLNSEEFNFYMQTDLSKAFALLRRSVISRMLVRHKRQRCVTLEVQLAIFSSYVKEHWQVTASRCNCGENGVGAGWQVTASQSDVIANVRPFLRHQPKHHTGAALPMPCHPAQQLDHLHDKQVWTHELILAQGVLRRGRGERSGEANCERDGEELWPHQGQRRASCHNRKFDSPFPRLTASWSDSMSEHSRPNFQPWGMTSTIQA
jgi:hypothetical protein